jgi:hypothetical protein
MSWPRGTGAGGKSEARRIRLRHEIEPGIGGRGVTSERSKTFWIYEISAAAGSISGAGLIGGHVWVAFNWLLAGVFVSVIALTPLIVLLEVASLAGRFTAVFAVVLMLLAFGLWVGLGIRGARDELFPIPAGWCFGIPVGVILVVVNRRRRLAAG